MKRFFYLLLIGISLALLFACAGEFPVKGPEQQDIPYRINVIIPHSDQGYWTTVTNGTLAADQDFPVDVKVLLPQLNYNVSQMSQLIRKSIDAKADGIICQGIDDPQYIAALEEAIAQGIQVALVDTDLPTLSDHLYVGTDNRKAGELLGEALTEIAGPGAKVVILSGDKGYPNLELRVEGIVQAAEEIGAEVLCVDYDEYSDILVLEKFRSFVQNYAEADTLICVEGTGGQILSTKLTPETRHFEHIIGFDLCEETRTGLTNGVIDVLVDQQPYMMGYLGVEKMYQRLLDNDFSAATYYTDLELLTAADLEQEAADENA